MNKIPTVAIIGRPNTGKSSLFNAFLSEKKAIVSDIAGTTRDNIIEKIWGDQIDYFLVDTAGLTNEKGESLEEAMQTQTQIAIDNADLILLLFDARAELTQDDFDVATKIRRGKKPFLFCANKIDDGQAEKAFHLLELGLGDPVIVSAKNNFGIWDLQESIEKELLKTFEPHGFEYKTQEHSEDEEHEKTEEQKKDQPIKIAIVGRPNVGKSSLLNALAKTEKAIVSDVSGTTRDMVDFEYTDEDGQKYEIIDTAGLRRPGKIERGIEFWSTVRTRTAIEQADVCMILIDALDGATHQDTNIISMALEAGKGIILGVNKFDLVIEKSRAKNETDEREVPEVKMWEEEIDTIRKNYLSYLSNKIRFLNWAPVLFFSAKTSKGVFQIFDSAREIYKERTKRIATSDLNRFVPEILFGHVSPSVGNKLGKLKYASQIETSPPRFLFSVNDESAFHYSYIRYIENKLRQKYGFFGTPIKLELRSTKNEKFSRKKKK